MSDPASVTPVALAKWAATMETTARRHANGHASRQDFDLANDSWRDAEHFKVVAALASQAAAPAVPVERVRELAKEWRQIASERRMAARSPTAEPHLVAAWLVLADEAIRCAAALEALAKGGDGGNAG